MATSVTFKCTCPECVVSVTVQSANDPSDADVLTFKASGSKTIERSSGDDDVSYRAAGTPGTDLSLTVTKGGTMRAVDRTLGDDGRAAGLRKMTVE